MQRIIFTCALWRRFIWSIIRKLSREFKLHFKLHNMVRNEYYMRVEYSQSRQVTDIQYDTMKEIVEFVYYNIPKTDYITYSLVCKDKENGKQHIIRLNHGS